MAILKLVEYPDARLYKPSVPVDLTDGLDSHTKLFIYDMVDTMKKNSGIGLSAVQAGMNLRIFIYDIPASIQQPVETGLQILINPVVTKEDGSPIIRGEDGALKNSVPSKEGCLSVPFVYEYVSRLPIIKVKYTDPQLNEHERVVSHLESFCIQHENDHLDGVLFIDNMSRLKKHMIAKSFKNFRPGQARKMLTQLEKNADQPLNLW